MQHFLSLLDYSTADLHNLIQEAIFLKREYQTGGNRQTLQGKALGMIFQKPSLRTRVSFEMAMQHLGGHALYLGPQEIGLGKRESIADVSRVMSGYVQGVMARVFEHEHVVEFAKWSSVPVINGLSDYNHPCQAMADVMTMVEEFGGDLRGMKVAYLGDGNNVTRSLLFAAAKFGFELIFCGPEDYKLDRESIEKAIDAAQLDCYSSVEAPEVAVANADVIYTDTWTSMGQEEEAANRRQIFPPYQVNQELVASAPKHAIVLHCLPAHRGEEITDDVADGPNSRLFQQAHNRLHAQKAILANLLKEC